MGDPQVHYALRAFLAARGPSTSVKMYSVLYFFTPVRCDVSFVCVSGAFDPENCVLRNLATLPDRLRAPDKPDFDEVSAQLRHVQPQPGLAPLEYSRMQKAPGH